MRIVIGLFILLLSSVSNMAQANIASSLTGPHSILAGTEATFTVHIEDSVTSGYDWEKITGISYSFGSGNGQSRGGLLTGLSATSLELSATFAYESAGFFNPYFTATVQTLDQYHYWVDTSYYQNSGYSYYCGFFCGYRWVDTSHWVYQGYYQTAQTNLQFNTVSMTALNVAAAAVPEPETYAMLLAGLGLMGWIVRRRQRGF